MGYKTKEITSIQKDSEVFPHPLSEKTFHSGPFIAPLDDLG